MEERIPSDPGFVVEWQLADDEDSVIDLAMAEAQVRRSDRANTSPAGRMPIEDDPDHPRWITTVRGVGYRFDP